MSIRSLGASGSVTTGNLNHEYFLCVSLKSLFNFGVSLGLLNSNLIVLSLELKVSEMLSLSPVFCVHLHSCSSSLRFVVLCCVVRGWGRCLLLGLWHAATSGELGKRTSLFSRDFHFFFFFFYIQQTTVKTHLQFCLQACAEFLRGAVCGVSSLH